MTDNPNTSFQGYRLLEPLGPVRGCNVFKAVSAQGDEVVAIKIYPLQINRNRSLLEQMRSSFQAVAQLQHPCILPVKNFNVHAGYPYIVMPYMESGSLKDRIECGAMIALNVEVVIGDLASALELAHSKGLIHGNLNPSQILFDEDGSVKLNGLGEAVLIRMNTHQMNSAQELSFDYRAPEVKAGAQITPLSDQYSLGLIALEMLTNLPIEQAVEALDMIKRYGRDQITRPSPYVLDLPRRMIAVLMQALSGDPSQRFPSIGVMYQAFRAALHNEDFRLESEPEPQPKQKTVIPEKRQRSRLVILGPILALALCLVVAIPALSSGGEGPLKGLMSLLGLKQDGDVVEVTTMGVDSIGGIDLGTAVTDEKSAPIDGVVIKATGISITPTVLDASGGAANDPINTPVPPAKTYPPSQPGDTGNPPQVPTSTATPTLTIISTEITITTATATEFIPTITPVSGDPINPSACKDNPDHKLYCTPTPSS
jgi:serine/threonine protein kinase